MEVFKTLTIGWSIIWAASVISLFIEIPYAYHAFKQNEATVLFLAPIYIFGVWMAGILIISIFSWIVGRFLK